MEAWSGCLDSGRLDAWTLGARRWDPENSIYFLVTSFLLLFRHLIWVESSTTNVLWLCWAWYEMGKPEFLNSGRKCWTLDCGGWTMEAGLWNLDAGLWMLDAGPWTLDATLWTLGFGYWTRSLTVSEQNPNPISDSAWLNHWKFFRGKSLGIS